MKIPLFNAAPASPAPRLYFVNPLVDFACIGGASILTFVVLALAYRAEAVQATWLWTAAAVLTWVCNYPHFAATNYPSCCGRAITTVASRSASHSSTRDARASPSVVSNASRSPASSSGLSSSPWRARAVRSVDEACARRVRLGRAAVGVGGVLRPLRRLRAAGRCVALDGARALPRRSIVFKLMNKFEGQRLVKGRPS